MADYYMVEKVLYKIKEVLDIENFDGSIILINRKDRLSKDITLKRVAILMTCVIRNGNKFYPQMFLDHALCDEYAYCKAFKKDISKELMPVA